MSNIRERCFLAACVIYCCAAAYRLLKLIIDPLLLRDSSLYLSLSESWLETNDYTVLLGETTTVPPLHLFLIKEMMKMGFSSEPGGRSIAIVLGSLIPVLGYYTVLKLFKNKRLATISAVLFVTHPTLVSYSIQPLRENLYLACLGLTIIELIYAIRNNKSYNWFLSGCCISLTFFCRYEAIEFLFLGIVYLSYWLFSRKLKATQFACFICLFITGFVIASLFLFSLIRYDVSFVKKIPSYVLRIKTWHD